MAKKILITGGARYIGSHTALELLNEGYEVVVYDNLCNSSKESLKRVEELTGKHITFYEGDVMDEAALKEMFEKENVDAVIHCAALKAVGESVQKPLEYYRNNITGTLTLMDVMKQTGVKNIFGDKELEKVMNNAGFQFSSANSINIGRLVPQIVYYVYAYARLLANGEIKAGEKINAVVPTGNFGNILAAFYAKKMGLPVHKLICASNENNVLTDFFATGTYDKKRDFKVTTSPSMDILVSSNLERLIFHLLGNDATKTKELMDALVTKGEYTLADADKDILDLFAAGFATEDETAAEIKRVYDEDKYIEDPHTAVASAVYEAYVQKTDDHTPTVIASTASPYKFPRVAVSAVTGKDSGDDFKAVEDLHQLSGVAIPAAVDGLEHAEVRHKTVVAAADMQKAVESYLGV